MGHANNAGSEASANGENGGVYEFKIKGRLDGRWLEWFGGRILRHSADRQTGMEVTEILATVADQPALHGFINRIRDLNLTLLSIRKLPSAATRETTGGAVEQEGKPRIR